METTIRNEQLTVVCDSMGGEQRAITSAEGIDYLWDGDARFWKGRAPTLFPFVGRLRNNRAQSAEGEVAPAPARPGPYPGMGGGIGGQTVRDLLFVL